MSIENPTTFHDCVERPSGDELRLMFSERGGTSVRSADETNQKSDHVTALIGSEVVDQRRDRSRATLVGKIVTFGGRILRAETAAIAVSALLQTPLGDLQLVMESVPER